MADGLEILERSEAHGHVPAPALVIIPDRDAQVDVTAPVLGRSSFARLVAAAEAAGFARVVVAPGTRLQLEVAPEDAEGAVVSAGADLPAGLPIDVLATGEPLDRPALVAFEGTLIEPSLLPLMVAHPLESGERYTLYDEAGRPAASFFGRLEGVPAVIPLTEELPWPEGYGPRDVVRQVYAEDRGRALALALRAEGLESLAEVGWRRLVALPTLRWLADGGRPLAQLNLLGMLLICGGLPLALVGGWLGWFAASVSLLLGVHVTSLIEVVRKVRAVRGGAASSSVDLQLAAAARPLGHAALMGGLTYAIVSQTDRSQVASVVLLCAGAAAAVLSLLQARRLLRALPPDIFALPNAESASQRLGVRWWPGLRGAPLLELGICAVSVWGVPELPWSILAAAAVARLWRWFAGPPISLREAVGDIGRD